MKHYLFLILFSFILSFSLGLGAYSQSITPEVIAPAGDYFTNGSNALSWTLGEPAVETFTSPSNKLTQGFQQPYYIITEITENKNQLIQINIFPNPAGEFINISINGTEINTVKAELFDATGKLILQRNIHHQESPNPYPLYIGKLSVAFYLLKISVPEKNSYNAYKIQKML